MEKNKIGFVIFTLMFLSSFLAFQIFSASAAITLVCTPCQQGTCNCNVNACPSGTGYLIIFRSTDCSGGVPVSKIPFFSNAAVWSPESAGTYYGRAICDDKVTKSDCGSIVVSPITITCNDETCDSQCKNQGNITGSCDSSGQCHCSGIKNGCDDGTSYGDCSSTKPKYCSTSGELVDNCDTCGCPSDLECKADGSCGSKITTSGGGSDFGLWIGIIIVVIIVLVIIYFLFIKKKTKSSPKASYEDLYRKWSK